MQHLYLINEDRGVMYGSRNMRKKNYLLSAQNPLNYWWITGINYISFTCDKLYYPIASYIPGSFERQTYHRRTLPWLGRRKKAGLWRLKEPENFGWRYRERSQEIQLPLKLCCNKFQLLDVSGFQWVLNEDKVCGCRWVINFRWISGHE